MLSDFGIRVANVFDKVLNTMFDVSEMSDHRAPLPEQVRSRLHKHWRETNTLLEELQLERSIITLRRLLEKGGQQTFTVGDYHHWLGQLSEDIRHDLARTKFLYVNPTKAGWFDAGFGDRRADRAFPEALEEIRESGRCFAAGRNTACVFHAMRAAEYGLRALARSVGAVVNPKVPLEYAVWDRVIQGIQDHIEGVSLAGWSAPAKANFRAFYNGSIADFLAFKDECRNLLMHTRSGFYGEPQALMWRDRVCACMVRLATRINQASQTALLNETDFAS